MKPKIKVWKIDADWHPYPWRFSIEYKGKTHNFAVIPNQCETKRSATMKARWRAKWLEEGTFDKKHKDMT